jgi:hypothetical protein
VAAILCFRFEYINANTNTWETVDIKSPTEELAHDLFDRWIEKEFNGSLDSTAFVWKIVRTV